MQRHLHHRRVRSTPSILLSTTFDAVQSTIIALRASEMGSTGLTRPHISHSEVHNIPDHLPHSPLSFLAGIDEYPREQSPLLKSNNQEGAQECNSVAFTLSREQTDLMVSNQITHKPNKLVMMSSQGPYWCLQSKVQTSIYRAAFL